jgi:coenzyme F420-reducing hydrogenase delta subunit|uniref:Uncharacterized protein n=1 Tax=viral metagenome TaxID=1070528 RepID=A0A6C0FBP2_9ZZZZ|tara:strand:+ start:34032 stop:34289 length:258 start_codon:yes stop_codon:yes gene_type:complete
MTVGTKLEVYRGHADKTPGGLEKKDIAYHNGRYKSKKKMAQGKKAIKTLRKLGFKAKKGTMKLFSKEDRKKPTKKRKTLSKKKKN